MAQTQKTIAEGITVLKESLSSRQQVVRVKNEREHPVTITIDITGSKGVEIDQHPGENGCTVIIPERQTMVLATLNLDEVWNVVTKYKCSLRAAESDSQALEEKRLIEELQSQCHRLCKEISLIDLSESHLRQHSLTNFVDPFFAPGSDAIYRGVEQINLQTATQWRRPKQFFNGRYSVFFEEIEPNDIKQGQLGDCWLMCALSSLAERPQLVRRLFLSEDTEAGIYRVRVCKDGEWNIVTLDDYFPCAQGRGPIFSHSNGNELWVLLLEKAFAKLVGSYLLLRGGWAHEGMSDLTGCPTTTYEFEKTPDKESLWKKMYVADIHGALIAAATPGQDLWTETKGPDQDGGLVPGHAYTVISLKQVRDNRVINIRNPWGTFEWGGDWSDKSPLWTEEMKAEVQPVLDEKDGTFWMSYADFLKHFVSVSLCFPEAFYEARLKGKFLRMQMEDGRSTVLSKFYYCLKVEAETRVFFGVHQEDRRKAGVNEKRAYLDLSILVFKRNQPGTPPTLVHCEPMKVDRQLEVEMELQYGEYIIVPKTSGCTLRRPVGAKPEGKPLLTPSRRLSALASSTFKDIFRKFDMMVSGDLSLLELRAIYESGGLTLSDEEFEQIHRTYSSTQSGLTSEGFLDLMEHMTVTKGESFTWNFLEHLGYDRDYYSTKSRAFMLTIHSKRPISLEIRDNIESNLTTLGLVEHIKAIGEVKYQHDLATLYSLRETYYESTIVSYMFVNKKQRQIKTMVDVSGCQNVALSTLTEVNRMTLEGMEGGVMLHFQFLPGDTVFRPKIEIVSL